MEIAFACEAPVRAALSRIGRTEDAAFSPGGGLIAVAGLARNRLLVLRLETRSWNPMPFAIRTDWPGSTSGP